MPAFSANVLDNEYLSIVIELGLLGLAALIFYLLWPAVCAFVARNRTSNPELRDLCAALGAAELAAVATSATFDSFSFPMFYDLQALIVGLIGAVWLIVKKEANEHASQDRRKWMNIFSIARSIWRHKWAAIPVIVLTVIAMAYVSVGKPVSYSAKAYMLLENAPLVTQTVNKDGGPPVGYNPVASLENLTQVGDVLSQMVTTPAEKAKIESKGAGAGYLVAPDNSLETPPILDITGVGSSPQQAIRSTQLISNEIQLQLYQLQVSQNVNAAVSDSIGRIRQADHRGQVGNASAAGDRSPRDRLDRAAGSGLRVPEHPAEKVAQAQGKAACGRRRASRRRGSRRRASRRRGPGAVLASCSVGGRPERTRLQP